MAKVQPIGELSIGDLSAIVASQTRRQFPSEEFRDEELSRMVGGVLNAFDWGVIRMASERGSGPGNVINIESLETDERLATRWMSRDDIVVHAMDTTGLPLEVVSFALTQIESQIDQVLHVKRYVRVAWLGTIKRSTKSELAYHITLSEELRFPSRI